MNSQRWIIVLLGIAVSLLAACSSPAVAEFSTTSDAGTAPFDVSFTLGETTDGDTFSWDFGDGAGSSESEPSHTFQDAGTFSVRLTVQKGDSVAVADTEITVEAGVAGWVVIEGGQSSVASLGSTQFTASAFDVLGNPVVNPEFRWNVDPAAGEIDDSGAFTAGPDLNTFDNGVTVEFERLGVVVTQSTSIEVTTGPLHAFSIKPDELNIQVGRSETIQVEAVDEAGHVLESALVLFTSLRTGDRVDSTGHFTAHTVASEQISDLVEVEVELGGQVIKATVSGIIRSGILDEVHVSTLPTSLEVGKSYQLESFAVDRFGNELELDELRWSVTDPGIGSITKSGFFTAGTVAGQHEEGVVVRGILNRVESFTIAPVTISAGAAEAIHIVPSSDSVPINAGSPFAVLALDAHGNQLDISDDQFLYEYSSAGRGDEIAMFIAGYELGDFENAITVRLPAGTAGNESELIAQSDISIRQRSSDMIAVELTDDEGGTIFIIDLESADMKIAEASFNGNEAVEIAPAWWPDGSRLVYVSDLTGELQIYSLHLETREIVQLTSIAGGASMPAISPDGQSLAFVNLNEGELQLYVADIPDDAETNPITLESSVRLSENQGEQQVLPYWSPDGTKILASQNSVNGRVQVVLFDPTLVDPPTTVGPFGSVGFGWTADGSGIHVGFTTADGALDLGTLILDESEPVFIGTNIEFVSAAWSPDDSELAAIDGLLGAGWIFDTNGTGFRRVIGTDQAPKRLTWRPIGYGSPVPVPELPEGSEPTMLSIGDDPRAPVGALDTSLTYSAVISTDSGDFEVELYDDLAPMTVENFINLSRIGFYDGLEFYRVVEGFISQSGDPLAIGTGGPGYLFNDEFSRELSHDSAGVLSMANAGSNTNGSQFFITHEPSTSLDAYEEDVAKNCANDAIACHSVFGRVTGGLEIVTGMVERDPEAATTPGVKILGITIIES